MLHTLYNVVLQIYWNTFECVCFLLQKQEKKSTKCNYLLNAGFFVRYPWANAPMSVGLAGLMLLFATPMCCALFPQKASMAVNALEPELQDMIKKMTEGKVQTVYYNKGL